jgi:hypothetical protein
MTDIIKVHNILAGNAERKRPLRRTILKPNLKTVLYECVNWIQLPHNEAQ